MNFIHSLEHLALSKVAVKIYTSPEVREYERKLVQPFYYTYNAFWEPFVREKVSSRVSFEGVLDKIVGAIKPLSNELLMWKADHCKILGPNAEEKISFCWKPEGTIDRLETAKSLVHGKDFTMGQRFILACYYWLKDEAIQLWEKMSPSDFESAEEILICGIFASGLPTILEQWLKWLGDGADCEKYYVYIGKLIQYHIKVPPPADLWQKLTREFPTERALYILEEHWQSSFGRNYLSKMSTTQQMEIFKQASFKTARLFLNWPLQCRFLEVTKCLREYFTEEEYISIFTVIVREKINRQFRDFDYKGLLKNLWLQSSQKVKEYAINHPESEKFIEYIY